VIHAPDGLAARVADVARAEVSGEGTVAVLGTPEHVAAVRAELGISLDADPASLLDEPIAVLTVDDARGLEFDSVVVVEPSAIAGDTTAGLRALYVAITRSTRALVLVHSEPLPAALARPG
jgi:DNA helicase IV